MQKTTANPYKVVLVCILFVLTSGCVSLYDPESYQENHSQVVTTLTEGQIFRQNFISRREGLRSLEFWVGNIKQTSDRPGYLHISLMLDQSPSPTLPFHEIKIPISSLTNSAPVILEFALRKDPILQPYTIQLLVDNGTLNLMGANYDIYPLGDATINQTPINADLGFRIKYDYTIFSLFSDIVQALKHFWLVLPLLCILVLPGWLLLDWSGVVCQHFNARIGLAIGISLSFFAVLLNWTSFIKYKFNHSSVILLTTLLVIVAIIQWRKNKRNPDLRITIDKYEIVLLFTFLITLTTRFIMVRDQVAPLWVDSHHHGLITRLILDNGAYPPNYLPYIDLSAYHSGFHAVIAFFIWLTGLPIHTAILWFGQVLNACIVFAMYLFSYTLTKNRTTGLFAAISACLLSPMPAYYTSWGRYPHLTGLVILPAAFFLTYRYQKKEGIVFQFSSTRIYPCILAALTISGLFMSHYRVAVFFFLLLGIISISIILEKITVKTIYRSIRDNLINLIILFIASIAFLSTWLPDFFQTLILPRIANIYTNPNPQEFPINYLTSASGIYLLVIAGLGFTIGIIRNTRATLVIIIWIGLLFLSANLAYFKLPGSAFINLGSVVISLFLPISFLAGEFFGENKRLIDDFFIEGYQYLLPYFYSLILFAILVFGSVRITPILNPVTFLTRHSDLVAINWMKENLSPKSKVLINSFSWGYGLYGGNDGGAWIPALAGQETIPPPILYGFTIDREIRAAIISFVNATMAAADNPEQLIHLLHQNKTDYIFLGARGGVFSPDLFETSNLFEKIYHADGVWIYKVK